MEARGRKGVISIDALISMILIVSLIFWMQSLVNSQTDDINVYGARLQTDSINIQYGSMINNYYAANPTSGLTLTQPFVKQLRYELKKVPIMVKEGSQLVTKAFEEPTYPIPEILPGQLEIKLVEK